jgi:hypothetical protein
MDEERNEVYERIPWETLERQGGDRQWLLIAVAVAVAVGALAYSFMKNQPPPAPVAQLAEPVAEPPVTLAVPVAPVSAVVSPLVVAEADLYAVDPERVIDQARAHAEWFAIEYFGMDGSEESQTTLGSLLPSGIPLPEAPEGVQVFVDWVGARTVTETAPLAYDVEVIVRSLMARGESGFIRQPNRVLTVGVVMGDDGLPRVVRPPTITVLGTSSPLELALISLPAETQQQVESIYGTVIGGEQLVDGRWRVVVMAEGVDGVLRPTTVLVP